MQPCQHSCGASPAATFKTGMSSMITQDITTLSDVAELSPNLLSAEEQGS